MTVVMPAAAEVDDLRRIVAARTGLAIEETRLADLAELLRTRAATRGSVRAYLDTVADQACPATEFDILAEALTVGETFFFRNASHFDVLAQVALPARAQARGGGRINVLSIGCASGDEPYSVAIVAREQAPAIAPRLSIRAFDLNPAALARARAATFSSWSLRATADEHRRRWFQPAGSRFTLRDEIRHAVVFEQGNLALDADTLLPPAHYDIVFCRNVLMYFEPSAARAAVNRIARAMAPDGFLFLGEAETLRGISSAFDLCHTHGAFYYRFREHMHEHVVEPLPPVTFNVGVPSVPPDAWIETIRAAAERIDELMHATPARDDEEPDLAGARASIERERFGDALHQLSEVSPQDTENADVLLLRAVSLVHGGDLDAGEASCRRLLDIDRFSAGGHYLLALCHEGRNDLAGARYHDEVALHLEPSFAMARLHLGLLERRSGRLESARTQLDDALVALEREDPSRLLLFGGGFAREGLLSLCRGALAACAA